MGAIDSIVDDSVRGMSRERSLLAPRSRVLVAVLPFVLAAGLVLLFDVMREIPPDYSSRGGSISDDHDAVIAAYHNGALPLHLLTVVATLGALALLSAGRGRGPLGIGWPTLIALAVMVIMALLVLAQIPIAALIVFLPLVLVVIGFAVVAGAFGAQVTARSQRCCCSAPPRGAERSRPRAHARRADGAVGARRADERPPDPRLLPGTRRTSAADRRGHVAATGTPHSSRLRAASIEQAAEQLDVV